MPRRTPAAKGKVPTTPPSAKMLRFVDEYAIDLNATQAAVRAGYSANGATVWGHKLRHDPRLVPLIEKAIAGASRKARLTAERVLEEMARLALFDPAEMYDDAGNLLPVRQMPPHVRAALASVEVETVGETKRTAKLKLWSKPDALRMLGQHFRLLRDVMEHSGPEGGPIETRSVDTVDMAIWFAHELLKAREARQIEGAAA